MPGRRTAMDLPVQPPVVADAGSDDGTDATVAEQVLAEIQRFYAWLRSTRQLLVMPAPYDPRGDKWAPRPVDPVTHKPLPKPPPPTCDEIKSRLEAILADDPDALANLGPPI